jgi:hypothetical protein
MTLPDSSFLPAPLWVITALHVLTLSLHFVAMNFVLGGTLIVLMGRFERRWENPTVRRFIALFPSVMAATVTLGVAPLLFLQLVYPRQMYSAAIVSGWFWLLVIPAVIATYYLFHAACRPGNAAASSKARFLWPALCGLLYVSLLYSSVFSLAEHPGLIQQLYARSQTGFQWNPHLGNYLFRWLHMVLGAVTVGAYFVGLLGKDDPETFPVARRLFGFGMAAAAAAGFAYLVSLQEILPGLMRTPAIWALLVAILLSLGSLHFYFQRRFLPSGLALFVSLLLMVSARQQVRVLTLQGHFSPASWRIAPQWYPFLLFLVCLVIAAILVVYMMRLFFGRHPDAPQL